MKQAIAYYRVSTAQQGISGLGLEAQRFSVEEYAAANGYTIAAEFTEVVTGKAPAQNMRRRQELRKALEAARELGAPIIVAKLDRLARDAAFVLGLRDAGIEFIACDFPACNRLVITVVAAVAEYEAKLISERTKAGLAAAKRRGKVLGGQQHVPAASRKRVTDSMHSATREKGAENRARLAPLVQTMLDKCGTTTATADMLTRARIPTLNGKMIWTAAQVQHFITYGDVVPL
jgi:DNA invertase Pin-like site-specific DNA recombinase